MDTEVIGFLGTCGRRSWEATLQLPSRPGTLIYTLSFTSHSVIHIRPVIHSPSTAQALLPENLIPFLLIHMNSERPHLLAPSTYTVNCLSFVAGVRLALI